MKTGGSKLKKIILLAAVLALVTVTVIYARPMGLGRVVEKLGLSDKQIEQMQNLKFQFEKDMIKPEGDLKLAMIEFRQIMMQPNIDEKAALSKQDRISEIKADIAKLKLQHMIAASKILTADQLAQWKKMRQGMGREGRGHKGFGGRFGGMMMGGGPGCGMMGNMGDSPMMGKDQMNSDMHPGMKMDEGKKESGK
jgi:Spy/CpxP family protein refolding chaperone